MSSACPSPAPSPLPWRRSRRYHQSFLRVVRLAFVLAGCSSGATMPAAGRVAPAGPVPLVGAPGANAPVSADADGGTVAPATADVRRLSLPEAIALALRHNQRIKVGAYGPAIGRAGVLAASGRFDPALTFRRSHAENEFPVGPVSLGTYLAKTDGYALALEGFTPWGMTYQVGGTAQYERGTADLFTNEYVTFGGITITQPLLRGFGFGANLAELRIAKADRAISDWQYRQTVIDTVTNTILMYVTVAEARENLRIAQRSRELAAQLVRENEKRNQIGTIADADVTQARAQVANREEIVLLARRGLRDLENQLRELLGESRFLPDGPEIVVEPLTAPPVPDVDGAAALRIALGLRPDYRAAEQGVAKRRASSALARNELLPRVDFVGSYGYNGIDPSFAASRTQVRDRENRAYSAGVVVSIPLTFAEGRGRARGARLAYRQSQADLVRLQQDIAVAIAAAIGNLETMAQRVKATGIAYDLAQQALDAEEKRFRAGTSTTFFVLRLQEQLIAAQSRKAGAIADERRAIANFERETGTTLVAHHLKLETDRAGY